MKLMLFEKDNSYQIHTNIKYNTEVKIYDISNTKVDAISHWLKIMEPTTSSGMIKLGYFNEKHFTNINTIMFRTVGHLPNPFYIYDTIREHHSIPNDREKSH